MAEEKIVHVGGGVFVDTEPVDPPDGVDPPKGGNVYAYASFRSLEHVSYGLFRTTGAFDAEETDSETVGSYGMEPIATYWDFNDALESVGEKFAFEENPFVEVTSKKQYDEALSALDGAQEDGAWDKPGLYDFRDDPPTYVETVEEYEENSMRDAADQAIDFMFQGDDWEAAYRELAEVEDDEEEEGEEG